MFHGSSNTFPFVLPHFAPGFGLPFRAGTRGRLSYMSNPRVFPTPHSVCKNATKSAFCCSVRLNLMRRS